MAIDGYGSSVTRVVRSLVLVVLAVFLASNGGSRTDYSFTNVLGQIGLGYSFAFLVLGRPIGCSACRRDR